MGNCGSELSPEQKDGLKDDKKASRELDSQMATDNAQEHTINKLLLLGAGESGKSTLFKQMITLYGKGYSEEDRRSYIPIVFNNTLQAVKSLAEQQPNYAPLESDAARDAKLVIDGLKGDEAIDERLAGLFNVFWKDGGVQKTFEFKSNFQITDSCQYFMERVFVYAKKDFVPTEQDIFRTRVRTTGIVENSFDIDGNKFRMFDVGGQRNERKKWIHCFENVTAVLFVAAISAYDQVLYEDEKTNRMVEALNLFEEICNSRWFRDTAIILFMNKKDIFAEKIERVPLSVCFGEYTGDGTCQSGAEFVKNQFERRNRNADKQIYAHITCATDTTNISKVFDSVKDIIIQKSLNEAGLL